jgi:hypothetical protein
MHRVVFNGWADRADPRSMTLGYSTALDAIALKQEIARPDCHFH